MKLWHRVSDLEKSVINTSPLTSLPYCIIISWKQRQISLFFLFRVIFSACRRPTFPYSLNIDPCSSRFRKLIWGWESLFSLLTDECSSTWGHPQASVCIYIWLVLHRISPLYDWPSAFNHTQSRIVDTSQKRKLSSCECLFCWSEIKQYFFISFTFEFLKSWFTSLGYKSIRPHTEDKIIGIVRCLDVGKNVNEITEAFLILRLRLHEQRFFVAETK